MRTIQSLALALVVLLALYASPVQAQASDPAGTWLGSIDVGMRLRLVFHIARSDSGGWTATMDSPDQGATDIPMDRAEIRGDSVLLNLAVAMARFEGVLGADSLRGHWIQGGRTIPLTLGRSRPEEVEMKRPQEPKPPFPYTSQDVTFDNPAAEGVTLAGTITLPEGDAPHPAVVLVSGSGAQNRDEELLGHKPFLVLADYLTRRGIAVLRYDDRGTAGSTGSFMAATTDDLASDAVAAVSYLGTRDDIRKDAIGLAGHSEGGLIAPMASVQSDAISFIVLLAGTGMNGQEILYDQAALILRADGADEPMIETNRKRQRETFAVLTQDAPQDSVAARLRRLLVSRFDEMTPDEMAEAGVDSASADQMITAQVTQLAGPWFRRFLVLDPVVYLRQVRVPVLAINGSLDLQVPSRANLDAIDEALRAGGNENFTTVELEGLNHLFQTAETGSPSEYAAIEETMSPRALQVIGDWLVEIVRTDR